jgi:hypothetical protein
MIQSLSVISQKVQKVQKVSEHQQAQNASITTSSDYTASKQSIIVPSQHALHQNFRPSSFGLCIHIYPEQLDPADSTAWPHGFHHCSRPKHPRRCD